MCQFQTRRLRCCSMNLFSCESLSVSLWAVSRTVTICCALRQLWRAWDIAPDQSESSVQVTWSLSANQRPLHILLGWKHSRPSQDSQDSHVMHPNIFKFESFRNGRNLCRDEQISYLWLPLSGHVTVTWGVTRPGSHVTLSYSLPSIYIHRCICNM